MPWYPLGGVPLNATRSEPKVSKFKCNQTLCYFDLEDSLGQGSGTKPDIYAFPLSIKSQTITAKRAGKAEKAVAANKFNAGT